MDSKRSPWLILFGLGTGLGLLLLIGSYIFLHHGEQSAPQKSVLILRGSSLLSVSNQLHEEGIIQHPKVFRWYLRLTGGAQKVRAGEFSFWPGMSLAEARKVLYFADPIVYPITIPEGWTAREIIDLLVSKGLGNRETFISLTLTPEAATKYKLRAPTLEGYLFPESYQFSKVDGEEKIIDHLVQTFFQKFTPDLIGEANIKKMSLEQLVTLASIVEKETSLPEERPLISSVFHNRLKKRMRLQSDPTTIYGIPNFNGNITRKDLTTPTPYNTYTIFGLPPGAIANPGYAALLATLRPAESTYLYFVANKDGGHAFSNTYQEHLQYVDAYLRGISKADVQKKTARKPNSVRRKHARKTKPRRL